MVSIVPRLAVTSARWRAVKIHSIICGRVLQRDVILFAKRKRKLRKYDVAVLYDQ